MKFHLMAAGLFLAAAVSAAAPKYVFLFIGDGMSTPQRMIAEEFALATGHGPLTLNHFKYHATTRTASATSLVTDSAAAATAIACGTKTLNGAVGVDKDLNRLESVAELAHAKGRKVGIVTTVTINHATPAGFTAHRRHRGLLYQIGLDQVASGFEYYAGGGFAGHQNNTKDPEYKGDLLELAAQAGYTVVTNTAGFRALKPGGKAFYRANDGEMQYTIDADGTEPTLAEMTAKGIELLDGDAGFFMMIEGGKLDHAGHTNDAASNLHEALALDDATRVAKAFMEKHPDETLIVTTGDHETGGMAMGFAGTGYAIHPRRLAKQRCSADVFRGKVDAAKRQAKAEGREFTFDDAQKMLEEWYGFDFSKTDKKSRDAAAGGKFAGKDAAALEDEIWLTAEDVARLKDTFKKGGLTTVATQLLSAKAGVGWTSGAHTALPVLSTSEGVGAEAFVGLLDNTDIANKLKALYNE